MEATTRASAASVFNILRPFLPSVYSYGDLINHLLFFLFHMFERFHYRYYRYYGLVFEYINLSDIDCATYHSFIFRLFLLFALSLRSFACFAGPFLRRLCFTYVSLFLSRHIICLTIYHAPFLSVTGNDPFNHLSVSFFFIIHP